MTEESSVPSGAANPARHLTTRFRRWVVLFLVCTAALVVNAMAAAQGVAPALAWLGVWLSLAVLWLLILAFMAYPAWFDGPIRLTQEGPSWRP